MFKRSSDYTASNGTHLITTVKVSPESLTRCFGEPDESDGYKSSMEWLFEDGEGNVVTLYDWKSTKLYSPELPSADILRVSPFMHEFHIGAHSSTVGHAFADWLVGEVS